MRRLKGDRTAVAGFFEDLPTLLIVLVATTFFMVGIVSTVNTYQDYQRTTYLRENLQQFIEELRNFDYLTKGIEGRFSGERVLSLNKTILEENFNTSYREYEYRLMIDDRSRYSKSFTKTVKTDERPLKADVYSESSTVTVVDSLGNEHLCEMVVSIW